MKSGRKIRILVDKKKCDFCGTCVAVCEPDAIELDEADIEITDRCTGCLKCKIVCPVGAIEAEKIEPGL